MSADRDSNYDELVEHSPLECDVTREGVTVRVVIFRMRSEMTWVLQIKDERGGATLWDRRFRSDQAALDEALQTIQTEGIRQFVNPLWDPEATWSAIIANGSIAELRRLLDGSMHTLSFRAACGVVAAAYCGPFALLKRRFALLGLDRDPESRRDPFYEDTVSTLACAVTSSLRRTGAGCCLDPNNHAAIREFCAGFVKAAGLDPVWAQDGKARAALVPFQLLAGVEPFEMPAELKGASREEWEAWLQRAREALPQQIVWLDAYWSEQGRDKEACACGSGKSYKRCCAN